MKATLKAALLFAACVGVVGLIVFAFLPQPVAVDMAVVHRGPMDVSVDEDGKTRIKERYVVSSPLAGRLLRLKLDPGDEVTQGKTLLATIEPTEPELLDPRSLARVQAFVKAAQAALQKAGPEVERASAAMEFANSSLSRISALAETDASTQRELDNAELLYRTTSQQHRAAKFAEDIARFELEMAKAALVRTRPKGDDPDENWSVSIRSPVNGRVLRVFQESARVVKPGSQLVELGDPRDLEVEVDVLSKDAVRIEPGASVQLEQWGGDMPLTGTVRLVEPQAFTKISALGVEEQRVNVVIDFLERSETLKPIGDGYRVEAKIIIWQHQDVIRVPTNALFREGNDWAVFLVRDGRAEKRQVSIGHRSGMVAEVLDGLTVDDRVIMNPSDQVLDGTRVEPRATSKK